MDWERELTGTCKVEQAEAEVRQLMKLSNSPKAARTKVGRWDGQTTNSCQGDREADRQTDREAQETARRSPTRREMDAYARLSRFPTDWELAGWCWLIGVNCGCDCDWKTGANDPDPDPAGRSGALPVRACGATSSRPATGLTPGRAGHCSPACWTRLPRRGPRRRGAHPAPSHLRGLADPAGAHYSYTYSV